jgi:hypothetical protein
VESRRSVSFKEAEVWRLSRRSVIPSSGDGLCGWGGGVSVCLGWGGWRITTGVRERLGLEWPTAGEASSLVCPLASDGLGVDLPWPEPSRRGRPEPRGSCLGRVSPLREVYLGPIWVQGGVRRSHPSGCPPLARALQRPPFTPSTYCNHDSWQCGCPRSYSI